MDHDTVTNEAQHFVGSKELADVRAGSCQKNTCPNMRCLETRTGKPECVNETWNYTEVNTTLVDACMVGALARVKYILSTGRADINSMGNDNMTPVMHAAKEGHREVFDLLVQKGANLSLVDDEDRNILHLASIGGNVDIVNYVLTQKIVGINSRDTNGWTPVMKAASEGHKNVFDVLVEAGADLFVNNDKKTIFHIACGGGNIEIIKYLMTHGNADIDSLDKDGWTQVMHAVNDGHKDVFDVLVKAGANLSKVGNNNETILHLACEGKNVEIVKYLLKHDIVNIDSVDMDGWTSVMYAVNNGHKDVFDVLVKAGANLSVVGYNKETTLHLACEGENVEIVKYLLKHDTVNIDSVDMDGITSVMYAVNGGHKDVFDVLVKAGANLSQLGNNKETILHLASEGDNVEIVKYLLKHDIVNIDSVDMDGLTPVMYAISGGHKDVFDVLVEAGASLSLATSEDESVLHLACGGGNVEIIKYIMTHATVDIDSRDNSGFTPVMHAAIEKSKDVFNLLVEGGADLSILDYDNNNILHLACEHDSVEIVKYLLTHNIVDINSRNGEDCTPAMIAARDGHEAIFFLVVENEADLTIANDAEDNILSMACEGGNIHIVKYVLTRHTAEGREDDPC